MEFKTLATTREAIQEKIEADGRLILLIATALPPTARLDIIGSFLAPWAIPTATLKVKAYGMHDHPFRLFFSIRHSLLTTHN